MTIQTFIEKAIEGGWKPKFAQTIYKYPIVGGATIDIPLTSGLLDPEAWKAVGKVEGWDENASVNTGKNIAGWITGVHVMLMMKMVGALAEGKTIEQYLETL